MATIATSCARPALESRVAEVNGVCVHYRRSGDGPETVVLLHGFPQTGRSWDRVAGLLAPRFTVIVSDLRGAGEPERPATGYDVGGMVADAHAAQWPQDALDLTMIEMPLPSTSKARRSTSCSPPGAEGRAARARPGPSRHEAPAARDRERPPPVE